MTEDVNWWVGAALTHPNSVAEPHDQLLDLQQQVVVLARVLKRRNLSALETFQEGWEKEGGEKRG